jgi:protein SCO1/2
LPSFSQLCWSIIICSFIAGCDSGSQFRSTDITGAPYGQSLELADHTGKVRSLEDFRGKAVVLAFGFTRCPDVCPTTLADISHAIKQLGADAERVQVLMVSLDPERDTPEVLAKYVTAFDPRFLALRGDLAATKKVAAEFKIFFEKAKTGDTYTINHSAQSYVIDPHGRLRLLVKHDRISQDLASDLREILRQ